MVILHILLLAIIAGYIALHILAVYKEKVATVLFYWYMLIVALVALIIPGLIGFIDEGRRIMGVVIIIAWVLAPAIIPVILHIFPKCKKWLKWILYIFQLIIVCICWIFPLVALFTPNYEP